jgi:hypothetical protein
MTIYITAKKKFYDFYVVTTIKGRNSMEQNLLVRGVERNLGFTFHL